MEKHIKQIAGVLCCVAFLLTGATYLIGSTVVHQTKDRDGVSTNHTVLKNDRSEKKATTRKKDQTKATTLEIVWMQNCPPCRRLKVVAIRLVAEGYDVVLVRKEDDTRGSTRFPSLYYLDDNGGLLKKETGFKTRDHIVEYLGK